MSALPCLVLASDLILITVPILAEMIRGVDIYDAVVTVTGSGYEPLCAIYTTGIELGSKVAVIGCSGVGRATVNGAAIAGLTKLIISIY